MKYQKEYQITLWGKTHYIDFTSHVKQRGQQREVEEYMKKNHPALFRPLQKSHFRICRG